MTNNEDLIGCCGLYCGNCFNYKGRIASQRFEERVDMSVFIQLLKTGPLAPTIIHDPWRHMVLIAS